MNIRAIQIYAEKRFIPIKKMHMLLHWFVFPLFKFAPCSNLHCGRVAHWWQI